MSEDRASEPPRKKIVLDLDPLQLEAPPPPAAVRLLPADVTVQLDTGESIFEGARRVGIAIPSECGGKGTCGRCRVLFPLPAREPSYVERQFIDRADLKRGVRLACRSRPKAPLTVIVLPERRR